MPSEPAATHRAETPARAPFKFLVCIDDSPQARAGLRFAALRARRIAGQVALLHVIEPPNADFPDWLLVADHIEQERREQAELLLHTLATLVRDWSGRMPELHIRQGVIGDEILALLKEDQDIHAVVVGAGPSQERRGGKLVSWLAGQLAGSLEVPLVIVPGNLDDDQIERLT